MSFSRAAIFLSFLILCCGTPKGDQLFYAARNQGKVSSKLDEASGLVASIANPGMLWSINDSGNPSSVFLIDDHAKIKSICNLARIENRDWEDITIGAGPIQGLNYLYVGDIGDNNAQYDLKYIYRFPEPKVSITEQVKIKEVEKIVLRLPDRRRDTETLMMDPQTNDLYIISKREDSVVLYRTKFPFSSGTIVMENLGKLPFKLIVAGSFSANGNEILLKNYNKIFYWRRSENESFEDLLKRQPIVLSYEPEHQGEAIAWARDSGGFYTLSESSVADRAQLRYYQRKESGKDVK